MFFFIYWCFIWIHTVFLWGRKYHYSFFFFTFYLFIFFIFLCSGFCHTLKWNSHGFTCVPHPDPPSHLPLHLLPLGFPTVVTQFCYRHKARKYPKCHSILWFFLLYPVGRREEMNANSKHANSSLCV